MCTYIPSANQGNGVLENGPFLSDKHPINLHSLTGGFPSSTTSRLGHQLEARPFESPDELLPGWSFPWFILTDTRNPGIIWNHSLC